MSIVDPFNGFETTDAPSGLPLYPATPAQKKFATDLINRKLDADKRETAIAKLDRMEKRDVSAWIDDLKAMPNAAAAPASATETAELEAGMYRVGGVIFKVQRAVHGSGRMYAKRLVVEGEGTDAEVFFEYANGAIRSIRPEHRMSIEEAKAFGALYGVCCVCAATLTDEKSIAAGIGPVCGGRV